jgi:hypothetical protein
MMRRRALLCALISMMAISLASAADDKKTQSELCRYLGAISFGETFQGGVRKANGPDGGDSEFLHRILSASPQEIEATVAPAFASHVSLPQARALADFFTSELGQKVIAQGRKKIGDPDNTLDLSPQEQQELDRFAQTPAGKISVTLTSDAEIRQAYFALLKRRYGQETSAEKRQ